MKRLLTLAVGAMLLAPAAAGAAERTKVETKDDSVSVERDERSTRARMESSDEADGAKVDVALNGGIGDFTGDVGSRTELGPAYGLIAGVSTMNDALSAELGFQGHTNDIKGLPGRLTNSKMQIDLKAGPELRLPVAWRPYAFGGVGVNWVSSSNDASGLTDAVMGVIPLGIGADFFTDSPVRVGARATYDLTPGIGSDVGNGDLEHPDAWNAALTAAAVF